MKTLLIRTLLASFSIAVLFCTGCEEGEKAPMLANEYWKKKAKENNKKNKGQDEKKTLEAEAKLNPQELHDKRMKEFKESQENALKELEKKQSKKKEDPTIEVMGRNSMKVIGGDKKEKDSPFTVIRGTPTNDGAPSSGLVGLKTGKKNTDNGFLQDAKDKKRKPDQSTALETTPNASLLTPNQQDPGFFSRLFGKKPQSKPGISGKDEKFPVIDPSMKGGKTQQPAFTPAPADKHDTLIERMKREMATRRIHEEQAPPTLKNSEAVASPSGKQPAPGSRETSAAAQTLPAGENRADVVDLDHGTAPAAAGVGTLAATGALNTGDPQQPVNSPSREFVEATQNPANPARGTADMSDVGPSNESDIRKLADEQYRKGLASRDVVIRNESFQRAAFERRVDAIPYLVNEVKQDMALACLAAQCLGAIGKLTPEADAALLNCISNRDPQLRQYAIESLGRLKSMRSVVPVIERLKIDKSYGVRSACAETLGLLGDNAAIPVLKAKVSDPGEIEAVRTSAGLALARLGDPSGRAHLIRTLDSKEPALQVLGLIGMARLNDPAAAAYYNNALESPNDEVWTTAVYLFARLGPALAIPVLRTRLEANNEVMRRRAALAMGFLGSDDAVPYIEKAIRMGRVQERAMGCEVLGALGRVDKIPLLVEMLQDPQTNVRQIAAVALTRLNAKEALPEMVEAMQGRRALKDLPPSMQPGQPDLIERLVLLSCVRVLRGEKDDLVLNMPATRDQAWPELDNAMTTQQVELVKLYQLVDVVTADNQAVGAVIKLPDGNEVLYKPGEAVAAGFKVSEIKTAFQGKDKTTLPPYVTLIRGDERVRLIAGRDPEVDMKEKEVRSKPDYPVLRP